AADIGFRTRSIKVMTGNDPPVKDQLKVIDGHNRTQRSAVGHKRRLRKCDLVTRMFPIHLEAEERTVGDKSSTLFQGSMQFLRRNLTLRSNEDSIHPYRPTQGSIVSHRVCPGTGRQMKTEIQEPIPDIGGRAMIGESD